MSQWAPPPQQPYLRPQPFLGSPQRLLPDVPDYGVGYMMKLDEDGRAVEAVQALMTMSSLEDEAELQRAVEQRTAEQREAEQRAAERQREAEQQSFEYKRAAAMALDHPDLMMRMRELGVQQDPDALVDWALSLPRASLDALLGREDDPDAADEAEEALQRRDVAAAAEAAAGTNMFVACLWQPWWSE